jgi:hypothetical protein
MKSNILHAVLVLMFLASGCAPKPAQMVEVPVPPMRIALQGYSLLPPNEKEWFIIDRNEQQIELVRKGNGPDETRMIQAMLLSLPTFTTVEEMASWVKEGQVRDADDHRLTIKDHDLSAAMFKGARCIRSAMTAEERQAVKKTDIQGAIRLEVLAHTCIHPLDKNIGVSVIYAHGHYPGQEDRHLADKADELFQSVEFSGF